MIFPGHIVYDYSRLDIIAVYAELHAVTAILLGAGLHEYASCQELIPIENRSYTIKHLVSAVPEIPGEILFEGPQRPSSSSSEKCS